MRKDFLYTGVNTKEISFPLGGIGTGSIGLSGNGRLIDWEIFNKPAKGSANGFSHFAVKAENENKLIGARILNSDLLPPYTGSFAQGVLNHFGFGPPRDYLAAIPHFQKCKFKGEYPIASLNFKDEYFPGSVQLEAFNPLIPLNEDDSSIPAAFFLITFQNTTMTELFYTVALCIRNPASVGHAVNKFWKIDGISGIHYTSTEHEKNDVEYGDLCAATDAESVSYQEYLYRGDWFDNLTKYWEDFTKPGLFKNRNYKEESHIRSEGFGKEDYGVIAAHIRVAPGTSKSLRFVLSWSYPNCINYWNESCSCSGKSCLKSGWKNYYATLFSNSSESALYALKNWSRLYSDTLQFKNALFSSTLPNYVLDAVSANISILKSPTLLRLEDGSLYGWEGCHPNSGCCDGSCSHVWNYDYVVPFLFPRLKRSMRDLDFKYNMGNDGSMSFRLQLPIGSERLQFRPCVDGQYGGILQAYREWKISGDSSWIKKHFEAIKKQIEYAWSDKNPDKWDYNTDGVIEGRQHHTLDMELFSPNAWLSGFYLAALKASSEIAQYFSENELAKQYLKMYELGREWVDKNLFNGEYYYQKIDLKDKTILEGYIEKKGWEDYREGRSKLQNYWDNENNEIKYQIAEGCHIDQLVSQWHALLCGLGDIFNKTQRVKALKSIYKYNFINTMRNFFNPCRVFCLNDEAGVIICSFPRKRPIVPIPYSEETMNGCEYQVAAHMIMEGMVEEGLCIVRAVRDRYNGEKRNPWNEFECGSNYVRSMSSYSLLLALSGFSFDMVRNEIGFSPVLKGNKFKCFWCLNTGWGIVQINKKKFTLKVYFGSLSLCRITIVWACKSPIATATLGSKVLPCHLEENTLVFHETIIVEKGKALNIDLLNE